MFDPLLALACAVPPLVLGALGIGAVLGLAAGRQNRREEAALDAILAAAGFGPTDEPPWRIAPVGGRIAAVKATRVALTTGGSGVRLGVGVVALIPLEVPLSEHLFQNGRVVEPEFARMFYVAGGAAPVGVPDAVARGLTRWRLEAPDEQVEAGPRTSDALYAGRRLRDATSVVRVQAAAPNDAAAARRWLAAAVDRVATLERDAASG